MNVLKLLELLSIFLTSCECYKYLALFQTPSRSHHILASKLFKEIAKKGHKITFVSPFVEKTPIKNFNVVPIESLQKFFIGKINYNN